MTSEIDLEYLCCCTRYHIHSESIVSSLQVVEYYFFTALVQVSGSGGQANGTGIKPGQICFEPLANPSRDHQNKTDKANKTDWQLR